MTSLLYWILAYLLAAIPGAIIVSKLVGSPNPLHSGSNNPGTTNMLRIAGKLSAAYTLAFDVLKVFLPLKFAQHTGLSQHTILGIAIFAFIGHLFPIYLRFKGGKGVAVSLAILLALSPSIALIATSIWVTTAWITRYSSLAALTSCVGTTLLSFFLSNNEVSQLILFIAVLMFIKHKKNIVRLWLGQESKIHF